jgi:hypothetical protein
VPPELKVPKASPCLVAVYGRGFAATRFHAMELITILNHCHRFRGFVYQHAYFSADKKSIEVAVRTAQGFGRSLLALPFAGSGYDQLVERGFEFIPLWGFLVFLLYAMRRVDCPRCGVVAVEGDEVRAGESRRIASEGGVPVLKKSRWLLLKREENLKTEQRFRLRDLLRYNLKTVRAYLLNEAFQQLWDYNSPTWAGKFLDDWCRQVVRSRIEPMMKIARSLRQHRELILNYFRSQKSLSSGVVEGLNNKAKGTIRKSYGFRTFRCLELALCHSLGILPEPESTHDFF